MSSDQLEPSAEDVEEMEESAELAAESASPRRPKTATLWLALAVPVAACGFAGSKEPWALGLVASVVALNLLLVRPQVKVPRTVAWPLMLAALLMLGAFLPLRMEFWPEWRQHLSSDFGINTPELHTPQPWITLESWTLAMVGLVWLWTCFGRGFDEAERRWMLRMHVVFIAVIAALAVVVHYYDIVVPFWRGDWPSGYFGPFPDRNNFGGYMAMGAVLAFAAAYDAWRRRSVFWLVCVLCVVCIVWALVSNTSRAGVLLFFGGIVTWMSFASFSRRSAQRIGVSAAIVLVFASVFLLFGQSILNRMHTNGGLAQTLSNDNRIHMARDSIQLMRDVPWLGVGLGNFEPAFNFVTSFSDHYSRPVHPENDWLWLGVECGLPVLGLFLLALLAWFLHTGPWRRSKESRAGQRDRRLRNACAIAVLMIVLHGLVDVPGHSVGVPFTMILVGALAIRSRKLRVFATPSWVNTTFRFAAATFCIGAAWMWFSISLDRPLMPGGSVARRLVHQAEALAAQGDLAGSYETFNRAIAIKPLQWNYYYQRATAELALGLPHERALEDFARVRYLEPHNGLICLSEAYLWITYDPPYAIPALREAMYRHKERAIEFYNDILWRLRDQPNLRGQFFDLATDPKLKVAYLSSVSGQEFTRCLDALLEQDPKLDTLTSDERLNLFQMWYDRGDRVRLLRMMDADALWRVDGWPVLAADRAAKGDFQGAYQLASDSVRPPPDRLIGRGGDLAQLRRDFLLHPSDASYGMELYEVQKSKGLLDDALATLAKVSQLPEAPKRLPYEEGVTLARKGDYAKAWEKMNQYIQSTR